MAKNNNAWPQERCEKLIELHGKGFSGGEIARMLSTPEWTGTRSAVCGQISRLRSAGALPPSKPHPNARRRVGAAVPSAVSAARLKAVPQKTYAAPIKQAVNVVDETKRIPFEALTAHSCRWPIGDPTDPDFGYCGEKKLAGKSYCAAHYERSITKCLHKT